MWFASLLHTVNNTRNVWVLFVLPNLVYRGWHRMRWSFISVFLLFGAVPGFAVHLGCVLDSYSSALFWVTIIWKLSEKGKNKQDAFNFVFRKEQPEFFTALFIFQPYLCHPFLLLYIEFWFSWPGVCFFSLPPPAASQTSTGSLHKKIPPTSLPYVFFRFS